MFNPAPRHSYAHRRLIVAAIALVLLLICAGTALAFTRSGDSGSQAGPNAQGARAATAGPESAGPEGSGDFLRPTSDPEAFARLVAETLFDWDTSTGVVPADLTQRLIAVADPTGESSAALGADIANYLPTPRAWAQLGEYSTRQWIRTKRVQVPTLWPKAVEQAGQGTRGGFLPGTRALTITGVRHRSGVWEGRSVSSARRVAFTAFIVCAPSYPQCHLLRLSRLDNPLN